MDVDKIKAFPIRWASHLPVLTKVISVSKGDILELGIGMFSTPILYWLASVEGRNVISYDNDLNYYESFKPLENEFHKFYYVTDWDQAKIDKDWDVVFIDLAPRLARKEQAKRLAERANFIILHDSDGKEDRKYKYSEIYPLFKYSFVYGKQRPQTIVLSNFIDVRKLLC